MVLYSQPNCGQCTMIHALLNSKHITYTECQDQAVMVAKGVEHTPTIDTGTELLTGKAMFDFIKNYRGK